MQTVGVTDFRQYYELTIPFYCTATGRGLEEGGSTAIVTAITAGKLCYILIK